MFILNGRRFALVPGPGSSTGTGGVVGVYFSSAEDVCAQACNQGNERCRVFTNPAAKRRVFEVAAGARVDLGVRG